MDKSMYSLMLMDEVVQEIDKLAYNQNTNRSNLINQILAQYLSITTPEMQVKEIFDLMTERINSFSDFKIMVLQSDFMISMKSPLEYKHRPTIKYSVELYRFNTTRLGEFRVVFRTQHNQLLMRLAEFFGIWIRVEIIYIHHHFPKNSIQYSVEEGRFKRTIMIPQGIENLTNELLSKATCEYIKMFDEILKQYLYNPQLDARYIENKYLEYLNNGLIIL